MDVALLNQRIVFQKNAVITDSIGNHKNSWIDYYSCAATIGGESGKETSVAGTTVENTDITFTVRFCAAGAGSPAGAPGEGQRVPAHGIGIQADPAARGPRSAAAGHFGN